jgi:hypothetical protein
MPGAGDATDLELLLIDGDNLLHAVRGRRDEGGTAWLLPRLARWRPEGLRVVVVLDGHPAPGGPMRQHAFGVEIQHAGSRSADDLIVDILAARPYAERSRSAVVTRDRDLRERVTAAKGQVRTTDWLLRGLGSTQRPTGAPDSNAPPVGIGQGRSVRPAPRTPEDADVGAARQEMWRPGRGATRKKGNPRRGAKARRRR